MRLPHAVAALSLVALTACAGSAASTPSGSGSPFDAPGHDGSRLVARNVGGSGSPTQPGGCPDPTRFDATTLARSLIMVGVSGDTTEIPAWLGAGGTPGSGAFVIDGEDGLSAGSFATLAREPNSPLIAVDYEGGLVSRHSFQFSEAPSAAEQAAQSTPAQVRQLAAAKGRAMRSVGVNTDFAPVVDLNLGSPIVGSRSFGYEPDQVITYASAFAAGLHDAGVLPVLKHFPGHGSAAGDSHQDLPTTDTWDRLRSRDLLPYRSLLAQPGPWAVMVGHLHVPGLSSDGELPTSLDPATYRVLRDDLHFTGPAITDDLADMRAVTDRMSTPEAVVRAIAAGADQALLAEPDNYQAAVAALADWGASDLGHRQRMLEAARRLATVLPCSRN